MGLSCDDMAVARTTKRWITAVAAAVLCAGVAELFCRLFLAPPGFEPREANYPRGLYEPHAVRGYSYAPNFEAEIETTDFQYQVRTNSLGLRGPQTPEDFEGATVLAVGDSLTAGWGLALEAAWPARLEARLREGSRGASAVRVVTAAVPGYNTRQIRLLAEEFVPRFRPRVVIAGIYPYGYSRMFDPYVLLEGQLFQQSMVRHVEPVDRGFLITPFGRPGLLLADGWMRENFRFGSYLLRAANAAADGARAEIRRLRLFDSGQITEQDAVRLRPMFDEILSMREIARSRGADFALLITNPQDAYGDFPEDDRRYTQLILEFAGDNKIRCYSPLAEMEHEAKDQTIFRFGTDAHWNARAHELAAAGLYRFLRETGLTPDQHNGSTTGN